MCVVRNIRLTLIIAVTAGLGCSEGDSVTGPGAINPPNSFLYAMTAALRATVGPNAFITAFGGAPGSSFAILVGTEGSVENVCAAAAPPSPQNGIIIETPSGKIPSHAVSRNAPVRVYEHPGVFTGFCDLAGDPLVASGRVVFNQTVNQFTGPGTGPGSFALQVTVQGVVDLVAGGQARLHAAARVEIRPDGTLVKDQELVTLTPL